jgi:hypothetical protein
MLANLQRSVTLWLKEKTGLTAAVVAFSALSLLGMSMGFIFLCVSGPAWAAAELGPVFGSLATAGVFLAIAACSFAVASFSRRRAQHRAALERVSRALAVPFLLNWTTLQLARKASR